MDWVLESPEGYAIEKIEQCVLQQQKSLNLDRLELNEVPKDIGKLEKLQSIKRIDLSLNNLQTLPGEIGLLTQLQELKLCLNSIKIILPREIGKLASLVNLKLSGNLLKELPLEIGFLTSLRILDVSNNNIKYLTNLNLLENLIELRVDNNKLKEIPALPDSLLTLVLSYNPICTSTQNWFENLQYLGELKHLELRGCKIKQVPDGIGKLINLTKLDLGDNEIAQFPANCFVHLAYLDKLLLDQNQIKALPDDIGQAIKLTTLTLTGNSQLIELPLSFRFLVNLKELRCDFEDFKVPPASIMKKGVYAIRQFMDSLTDDGIRCSRVKLFILGDEQSGKTSLVKKLRSLNYANRPQQLSIMRKIQSKNDISLPSPSLIDSSVINIDSIQFSSSKSNSKQTIEFVTWDFPGQKMYKLTHQFFITGRSLFCVLFDLRKDKIEEIEYWLQLIITRAGDEISIFIIGTHADDRKFREDGILQSKLESIANKYSSRCKKIILITAISSLDGTGIEELRDSLINEALKQNHFGEFIPKQFILLEDAIVNLREEKRKWAVPPIVSWNDYLKLVDNCYIHSPSVIQFATLLLHDLGVLLYFKYDHIHSTTPTQFIIIDPQWLIDMTVFVSNNHYISKNGLLRHTYLEQVWKPPFFPTYIHQDCLTILRMFGITYKIDEATDIMPSLLPLYKPDVSLLWLKKDLNRHEFTRLWKFEFIPMGLFYHFLIHVKLLTNVQSIWQHGCIFSYEYSTAIIEEIEEKQMISIKVRVNENNCKLIGMINEIIEQLLNNYYRKRGGGQQHIPCPHCINENIKEPYIFSTNECEDNLLAGLHQVNCLQDLENPVPVDFRNIASDIILKDCDEYRIDYKDIVIQDKLGEGAYGILYKGTYNGSPVAIKVIRTEMVDSKDQLFTIFHEFKKEVLLMSELRHKNIVELKGFSIETNNIAMVMELMDQGDLYRLIQGKNQYSIDICIKLAYDIATGMEVMHNSKVIHRDLKPPNILLKTDKTWQYVAKIADFGLSIKQYLPALTERAVETPIWLAPEILGSCKYNEKSDIYSFAIILFELISRRDPFDNLEFRFLTELEQQIIDGHRCDIESIKLQHPQLANLITDCWNHDLNKRPTFQSIKAKLIEISKMYNENLHKYLTEEEVRFVREERIRVSKNKLKLFNNFRINELKYNIKFQRRLQIKDYHVANNIDEISVCCLLLVGSEVWSAHKNGDINIWHAESGKLFQKILAAHSREIRALILVNNRVWSASRDGFIRIWIARSFDIPSVVNKKSEISYQGYVEPILKEGVGNQVYLVLHHGDLELLGVPLTKARVFPNNDPNSTPASKLSFTITTSSGASHSYACPTITERDAWVKSIAYVSRNLSEETQDLNVDQIPPRSRRDEINTLLYHNGLVYVGTNDLHLRIYNPETRQFIGTQAISESGWKIASITPTTPTRQVARHATFSVGKARGESFASASAEQLPIKVSPITTSTSLSTLAPSFHRIYRLYAFKEHIWAVVHNLIFRLDSKNFRTTGKLVGHTNVIKTLVGINDNLWSCCNDKTIRVWDIRSLECISVFECNDIPTALVQHGNTIWCGEKTTLTIWDGNNNTVGKILSSRQIDFITSLIVVWDRVVWSGSLDGSICIWS